MSTATKPRYQQVKDLIIERISRGDLQVNDRVPSENELVDVMAVSRMTANRALRELTDEGFVQRVAGRGTFVADFRARSHVLEVHDIAEEIRRRGHRHSSKVVRHCRRRAPVDIARALHVDKGADVYHLLLVHFEDATPIQLEDRHILAIFAADCLQQDFERLTPSAYLTSISPLAQADHWVRASMPDLAVRKRLRMRAGEPCLVVTRRTWASGRPVTLARLHHPGSRYELTGHYSPPGKSSGDETGITMTGTGKNRVASEEMQ